MRTRIITLFTILFSVVMLKSFAQEDAKLRYNMLKTDYKTKNYDSALKNLEWCLENSPKLTANIYIYGGNLLGAVIKTSPEKMERVAALGKKMYEKRFENFPNAKPAKAHSDYADFLEDVGADKEEVFKHYEIAFKIDPAKLGVGSIISYFTTVLEKNKETNLQYVFNTYDTSSSKIKKATVEWFKHIK